MTSPLDPIMNGYDRFPLAPPAGAAPNEHDSLASGARPFGLRFAVVPTNVEVVPWFIYDPLRQVVESPMQK